AKIDHVRGCRFCHAAFSCACVCPAGSDGSGGTVPSSTGSMIGACAGSVEGSVGLPPDGGVSPPGTINTCVGVGVGSGTVAGASVGVGTGVGVVVGGGSVLCPAGPITPGSSGGVVGVWVGGTLVAVG